MGSNTTSCMSSEKFSLSCGVQKAAAQNPQKPPKSGLKKENGNDILSSLKLNIKHSAEKQSSGMVEELRKRR